MIQVWYNRRLARCLQFIESEVESFLKTLVGRIFVLLRIVGYYADK
jgi:hypothetical protein